MRPALIALLALTGCAAGEEGETPQQRCDRVVREAQKAAAGSDRARAEELAARAQTDCRAARAARGKQR